MRVSDLVIEGVAVVTFLQLADALCWWDLESGCLIEGEWLFEPLQGFFLKAFSFGVFKFWDSDSLI